VVLLILLLENRLRFLDRHHVAEAAIDDPDGEIGADGGGAENPLGFISGAAPSGGKIGQMEADDPSGVASTLVRRSMLNSTSQSGKEEAIA